MYGRQKPACSHFAARIFRKIPAGQLTLFIRKLLQRDRHIQASNFGAARRRVLGRFGLFRPDAPRLS